ncbi:MAG: hypothetical protein AAAB36_17475, partial [Ensifer adhaerens]
PQDQHGLHRSQYLTGKAEQSIAKRREASKDTLDGARIKWNTYSVIADHWFFYSVLIGAQREYRFQSEMGATRCGQRFRLEKVWPGTKCGGERQ